LAPDLAAGTLTVRLHYLSPDAQDLAVSHLCDKLNETTTIFPGSNLRIVYEQLGSE